ncbi:hypothetical protein MPNT_60053 [Candidatus Methylacidithermus pantelleriae]|uniref:Uncharacterized protein n=1 Tax=Candidatus Methylacidithermus pantelleriae TaxID=2744239 RepID=A0A8J2BVB3_9BACT|nr:hypothetical protein MPNT_60053 [Candidatus Methylacidithermus pantelleriae]
MPSPTRGGGWKEKGKFREASLMPIALFRLVKRGQSRARESIRRRMELSPAKQCQASVRLRLGQ